MKQQIVRPVFMFQHVFICLESDYDHAARCFIIYHDINMYLYVEQRPANLKLNAKCWNLNNLIHTQRNIYLCVKMYIH